MRYRGRGWKLAAAIGLILGAAILYLLSHSAMLTGVVSGGIILTVAAHFGLLALVLAPLCALFRRRSPR